MAIIEGYLPKSLERLMPEKSAAGYREGWAKMMMSQQPGGSLDYWLKEYDRQLAKPITVKDPNSAIGRGYTGREGFGDRV